MKRLQLSDISTSYKQAYEISVGFWVSAPFPTIKIGEEFAGYALTAEEGEDGMIIWYKNPDVSTYDVVKKFFTPVLESVGQPWPEENDCAQEMLNRAVKDFGTCLFGLSETVSSISEMLNQFQANN